jgi:predicted NACHT family NTPase
MTGQSSLNGLKEALLPLFESGRTLLLVDGLDEIHNDAERAIFVKHLETFMDHYALSRLVVTSKEAGFALVAPSLTRFCSQWRIAPLDVPAIRMLCSHWNALMGGVSPGAIEETEEFVRQLERDPSIMRLAETPLLLTMLLVVKHGAGRLPSDRVTLYERAIEVLLSWNIEGHDPLSLKEVVPQLASVAFEFMKEGKQTATEREIIGLL